MAAETLKVLIVDDEPLVGQLVATLVQRVGFGTKVVESAASALEEVAREMVGLVITDLQMPIKDGVSLCRDLHKQYPLLPVVAMSGSGPLFHNEELQEALRAGAKCIVSKPFKLDEFYSALTVALGSTKIVGQTGR
jgi:CheY-like chemotaxis protein